MYAAAVVSRIKDTASARRLIAFLASDGSMAAIRKSGMEPYWFRMS